MEEIKTTGQMAAPVATEPKPIPSSAPAPGAAPAQKPEQPGAIEAMQRRIDAITAEKKSKEEALISEQSLREHYEQLLMEQRYQQPVQPQAPAAPAPTAEELTEFERMAQNDPAWRQTMEMINRHVDVKNKPLVEELSKFKAEAEAKRVAEQQRAKDEFLARAVQNSWERAESLVSFPPNWSKTAKDIVKSRANEGVDALIGMPEYQLMPVPERIQRLPMIIKSQIEEAITTLQAEFAATPAPAAKPPAQPGAQPVSASLPSGGAPAEYSSATEAYKGGQTDLHGFVQARIKELTGQR